MLTRARHVAVATAALSSLVLSACGGGSEPQTSPAQNPPKVVTVTQTAPPASTSTSPAESTTPAATTSAPTTPEPAATGSLVKAYADALAANSDPDTMRSGLKTAAPGSPAYVYLSHQANAIEAQLDGGSSTNDQDVSNLGVDGFKLCSDPGDEKSCITLSNFKVDASRKIVDLTVNNKAIAPRLAAGSGASVTSANAKFTFLTAYKSIQSSSLFVMVKVQTGSKGINPNLYSATYRSPSGKQRTATNGLGPIQIDADSNTIIGMVFPGVEPGGRVTLDGCVGSGCDSQFKAVIKVG